MKIYKSKIPSNYSYPLKTKDMQFLIEKFDCIQSIHYTNFELGKNPIISVGYVGLKNKNKILKNGRV
jgi:hypothetical protein